MEKTEAQRLRDRKLPDDETGPGEGRLQEKAADDFDTILGHYRILREIGRGGMGVVYLAEQIGPVTRRVLGDEHPATLVSMNALGSVIYKLGRYEEAEQIHRAVLEAERRQLGPEHPDVLFALNNLGNALRRQARLDEAEAVYREAIDLQRSVLGEGHVETARTTINLSKVLIKQGRSADAVELLDRAAGARPDIPDFGLWKGVALIEMARYGTAAAVFRKLVELDPADLQARSRLALCLLLSGRYEEALPEYRAALALTGSAGELEAALVAPLEAALSGRPEPDGLETVRELLAIGKS